MVLDDWMMVGTDGWIEGDESRGVRAWMNGWGKMGSGTDGYVL